jgi:hypothetical protein
MGEEVDREGKFQAVCRGLVTGDGLDAGIEHQGIIDEPAAEPASDLLEARSTQMRLARSVSAIANPSLAPGKALSSSTRGEDRASGMTVKSPGSLSSSLKIWRPNAARPPSSPGISG